MAAVKSKAKDEESLILLKYMYEHNAEHTNELKELADRFYGEEIPCLINAATEFYERGNALLLRALEEAGE